MERRVFVTWSAGIVSGLTYATAASSFVHWRTELAGRGFVLLQHPQHREANNFLQRLRPYLDRYAPRWEKEFSVITTTDWKAFGLDPADGPVLVRMLDIAGEVEIWSHRWLDYYDRKDEDDDEVECYPVSGGWWSVDGDWDPSWQKVRDHLFESPNHEDGEFEDWFLDQLKLEELQSLHSDHHREMIQRGQVHWDYVNVECPEDDDGGDS